MRREHGRVQSHVSALRPLERRPYDWAQEGVTSTDVRLIVAVCRVHDLPAVRAAGRRLENALSGLSDARGQSGEV